MVTVELGANPVPTISTEVPTGPEVGSRLMAGEESVTVKVFETELVLGSFNSMISMRGRWYVEGSGEESSRGMSLYWTCNNSCPIKFYSNSGVGPNPAPVTFTEVPTGPEMDQGK